MKFVGMKLLLLQKLGNLPDLSTFTILMFARNLDNQLDVKLITVVKSEEIFSVI